MITRNKYFKKYRSEIKKMNNLESVSEVINLKHLNYITSKSVSHDTKNVKQSEISIKQNEVNQFFKKKYFKYFFIVTILFIIILTVLIVWGVLLFKNG